MTAYAKAIIAAVLFALGLAVGWVTQGWRADARIASQRVDHAKVLADIATATEKTQRAVRQYEKAANAAITAADQSATERIAKNVEETDRLRACVAAGTCGVRIVTRYVREPRSAGAADSSASTVGDAALELDREAASRVLDLRESIKLDAEKLDYLQRYAGTCWRARVEAVK
ncbi:lysis system i-spanin subunit Rz [Diaphorobacter caeni]|uniref:lysis system i-spanin subunit Rz n=1 Tax=Diaphorobacter caeni TaxID=2784387 RepID=UPI00189002B5|nr:lysis system i-spanin subunit Rz [Diaphorobacter caeni]MBF5006019.1 lysis protein [Diaphorobacter caeni]